MRFDTIRTAHVGILARMIPGDPKPLGRQTQLIKGFFEAAENQRISMALFHPEDLLKNNQSVGYVWSDRQWIKAVFERPSVVYDRFYSSICGPEERILEVKRRLNHECQIQFVNPPKLAETATDKVACAHFLESNGILTPPILAETIHDADYLWNLAVKNRFLIIKPRFGRMGIGVMRICYMDGRVSVRYGHGSLRADNPWHLSGIIQGFAGISGLTWGQLIVQPCIELTSNSRRFFDIRILMQRVSISGDAQITGEVARVGGMGSTVPNIDSGGIAMPLDRWLDILYGSRGRNVLESVRNRAVEIYRAFEHKMGCTGELGLDMLLDQDGEIWVIEVNSKPGRIAFERLASGFGLDVESRRRFAEQRKNSILNPVIYAGSLAKNR
ncbi:YheC/YheD family protein [bacterium]|nr:YheC/YheD family protein [candidate division CSSED10-310 bacterium]